MTSAARSGPPDHSEVDEHDLGLAHDLPRLLSRRRAFTLLGGAGVLGAGALSACGSASSSSAADGPDADGLSGGPQAPEQVSVGAGEIPEETNGPYPADGSNGVNVLSESGVVRSDIRASFGGPTGVAEGIALTLRMTVVDVSGGNDALAGAAVYVWHCDRAGEYSMYSASIVEQNYLRGVQVADAAGTVQFTTVFPGCYAGRWPHVHLEVYPDRASATSATARMRISQLALPADACEQVYVTTGYEGSATNLAGTSLDSDMVFADGYSLQLATVTGSVQTGFTATLRVPV